MPLESQSNINRRYDVDSIRVIALILLIIYHIVIGFQPWGFWIGFITNKESIKDIWVFMEMINIWRIPILFVVSGMGVCFAMKKRNWIQIYQERTIRIFLPLLFGSFLVFPICLFLRSIYYEEKFSYFPNTGHLWFLGNIMFYIVIFVPIFSFIIKNKNKIFVNFFSKIINNPITLILFFSLPLIIETLIFKPESYAMFVGNTHGLVNGMICFFIGFIFILFQNSFWKTAKDLRFITLTAALLLYLIRIFFYDSFNTDSSIQILNVIKAIESTTWILAIFGFANIYINKPSKLLSYLSKSVYPVYIIHFPVQYLFSSLFFPYNIDEFLKLFLLIFFTYGTCILLFEIIKRIRWIKICFGIK